MRARTFDSNDIRINDGGLMRCCTTTMAGWCDKWYETPRPIEVNTVIRCLFSPDDDDHRWILDSTGTFRWFRKEA